LRGGSLLGRRLYQDALRTDLPEFIACALMYQAGAGDLASLPLARAIAGQVTSPALHARAAALDGASADRQHARNQGLPAVTKTGELALAPNG
jgi:hypothetical protein